MLKQRHFYDFDDFRVEPEERTIARGKERLPLTGKAYDLLVLLLKHHGRLLRKTEIISEIWPDAQVEEGNLNVQITTIRKVLGNDYIQAVPKQGYRFTADVKENVEDLKDDYALWPKSRRWIWLIAPTTALIVGTVLYFAYHAAARSARSAAPPIPGEAFYERALEYERIGDDEQALAALDQALAVNPHNESACVRAAFLAYELEQDQKASSYLTRCKATEVSDEPLQLKARGLTEALADNSNRALEVYQLLIDRYPRDVDGLYRFAELATDKDRLEEAEKALRRCLTVEFDNRYCLFELMTVDIKNNKFDNVLVQYDRLPRIVRDYPWFDEPVGVALFGKGQLDDAKRIFDRLSQSQQRLHGTSHFTVAKEWLADLLLYQGRIQDATRRIEQVMATSDNAPSLADSLAYLAQIHLLLNDEKQARKFAYRAASTPGATPSALLNAALALANLGESDGVDRVLKQRFDATHNPLSTANDHLIRGLLAIAKGDTAAGIEEIRLAKDLNPRDEEAAYRLGTAYFGAGDYDSALVMFQTVDSLRGTVLLDNVPLLSPLSKYHIAKCYVQLGKPDLAKSPYAELAAMWSAADEPLRRRYLVGAP